MLDDEIKTQSLEFQKKTLIYGVVNDADMERRKWNIWMKRLNFAKEFQNMVRKKAMYVKSDWWYFRGESVDFQWVSINCMKVKRSGEIEEIKGQVDQALKMNQIIFLTNKTEFWI